MEQQDLGGLGGPSAEEEAEAFAAGGDDGGGWGGGWGWAGGAFDGDGDDGDDGGGGAAAAGPGGVMGEVAFDALLGHAYRGVVDLVIAAVDQEPALSTRSSLFQRETLLHNSAHGGNLDLTGALLDRGADLHALNSNERSACWFACSSGSLPVVTLLLDKGASPHTRPPHSHSCISIAAAYDFLPIVLLLIAQGADFMAPAHKEESAWTLWGSQARPPISDKQRLKNRKTARAAFRAGPHPSQVARRAEERWRRRWPFLSVAVGHGFRPLAYQKVLLVVDALPTNVPIPLLTAPRPVLLRDRILSDEWLFRRIVSFL